MSEPIKPGDLVVLLWANNKPMQEFAGQIRTVGQPCFKFPGSFHMEPPTWGPLIGEGVWYPAHMKKIPPLSELESTKTKEELPA